jgi:hypothetical protein
MRDIAKLLFGRETGILPELFGADEADGFGLADQARRAGEWCGSTPGRGAADGAVRGVPGARRIRDQVIIREFRGW